jgi:hypothetical protein
VEQDVDLTFTIPRTSLLHADTEETEATVEDGGHRLKLQAGQTSNPATSKVSEISMGGSTSNISNQNITLKTRGLERVKLDSLGNFGIGTVVPTSALHVEGDITFTGNVFKSTTSWSQLGTDIDGEAAGDNSGFAVATSEDGLFLAIGAPNAEHVRVYTYSTSTSSWNLLGGGTSDIDDPSSGSAVSMSNNGHTIAAGGYSYNTNTGVIRIYEYDGSVSYNKIGTDIVGETVGDKFGWSVGLARGTASPSWIVATGAPGSSGSGKYQSGRVKVYQYTGGVWTQVGSSINGDAISDNFGWSVSMSDDGTRVAIGAYQSDGDKLALHRWRDEDTFTALEILYGTSVATILSLNGYTPGYIPPRDTMIRVSNFLFGQVRVYEYTGGSWTQLGNSIDGETAGDKLGVSVSMSSDGTSVAIGGHNSVNVYGYSDSRWSKVGPGIESEGEGDQFGWDVSLSNDGNRLVASAIGVENVRVYNFFAGSGIWNKIIPNITGEYVGDNFGKSVAISGDGTQVVVGANLNDDGGTDIGSVRVYKESVTTFVNLGTADFESGNTLFVNSSTRSVGIRSATPSHTLDVDGDINLSGNLYNNSLLSLEYPDLVLNKVGADVNVTSSVDFGFSTSISSDGTIVAIGCIQNTGTDPGFVRIYTYTNGTWTQLGSDITGENGDDVAGSGSGDQFGYSVSLSSDGTHVAIGAPYNNEGGADAGRVRIYKYQVGAWAKYGDDIIGSGVNQKAGFSVSLSSNGQIVAVGIPGTTNGNVSMYEYSSGTWTLLGTTIAGEAAGDLFGGSVSISLDGTYVAIGATNNGSGAGHVRVYNYSGGSWSQVGSDIDGEAAADSSGKSVSLSSDGTVVAIGAHTNDGAGDAAGHVRVYTYSDGVWSQVGTDIDGGSADEWTGHSISLSNDGNRLLVGAPKSDSGGTNAGLTRLYEYKEGSWVKIGGDIVGDATGDQFGWAVSLSEDGTHVISTSKSGNANSYFRVYEIPKSKLTIKDGVFEIGAANLYVNTETNKIGIGTNLPAHTLDIRGDLNISGNLYTNSNLFTQTSFVSAQGSWRQTGSDINGELPGDKSGWSVSMSNDGTRVAIGAPEVDGPLLTQIGYVRIYEYSLGVWTKLGQDIKGDIQGELKGFYVSLSADGSRVAISSPQWYDSSTSSRGKVSVFEFNGQTWTQIYYQTGPSGGDSIFFADTVSLSGNGEYLSVGGTKYIEDAPTTYWTQVGADIDGEAAGDNSGYSVAISSDGTRLAVGATTNDGGGSNSGHVRVYKLVGGAWTQLGGDIDGAPFNAIQSSDFFGISVALSSDGTRLAAGAYSNDANGVDAGHVRVFDWDEDDETWTQVGGDINGEAAGDRSGWSVDLSSDGTRLAVGATSQFGDGAGYVRVYKEISGTWTQLGADIDGEAAGDYFGYSVALSSDGTRLAVGATDGPGPGSDAGYVRVYKESSGAWTQLGADIDGEAAGDQFGRSVALSSDGTRLAVGASYNDANGTDAGHVRVFDWDEDDETWTQVGVDIDGETAVDQSGASVAISSDGTRLAVGAPDNDGGGSNSGHVRVFDLVGGAWTQVEVDLDGEAGGDGSGSSVALSSNGSRLAVGAFLNDGNGSDAGHVRVFDLIPSAWTQLGADIDGEAAGDNSGTSVALSSDGTRLAVGAPNNDGGGSNSGHVRVFNLVGGAWTQVGSDIDDDAAGSQFGWSVALSSDGSRLAVGGYLHVSGGGHVRVFDLVGSTWTQVGADIDSEQGADHFGISVALSSDGTRLAVGGPSNDGTAGADSGHVRVFDLVGSTWTQVGSDIDGEAAGDQSGHSVDLSSDGTRLAVGAYNNNNGAGHVRVYKESSGTWTQLGADIDGEDAFPGENFGWSVALSLDGTRLAVGAPSRDITGVNDGRVRVFDWDEDDETWTQVGGDLNGEAALDEFGWSIDLSSDGTRLAVGAYHNDGNGSNAGHVRVFEYNQATNTWVQDGLDLDGEAAGDMSGRSVALSSDGRRVASGGLLNDGGGTWAGHVRVFHKPVQISSYVDVLQDIGGTWSYVPNSGGAPLEGTLGSGDLFGRSAVSLTSDGSYLAVGAYGGNYCRVFSHNATIWSQVGADITGSGEFGRSIDLVVNGGIPRVAIGAPETSLGALTNIGAAHVLEYSSGTWSLVGSVLYGEAANDSFGISVSLSSDGTRLSVGSGENDAGGSNAGHVRTFDWSGSAWNQIGLDIDGDVVSEFSGNAVSLSGDGTQLAIGAYGSNADSGKVKVFNYNIPIVDKQTFNSTIFEIGTANIYVDTSLTRVGIGTSIPQATLDVNGPMRIDSIDLNKSLNQTWVKLKEVGPPDIVFPTMGGIAAYLNVASRAYNVVTIDGNRAAIPLTIIPASTQTTYPAVINVYEYDKNVWNVKYSIPEPANARNGSASGNETYWGQNIALSGDYLYVTAQYEGGGVIYVYKRNPSNGAWLFHTKLMAPSGVSSFGAFMDVSGDYVIAGVAPPRAGSNSISIFTRNPVDDLVWSQQVMFTDSHDNTGNLHAVAISGDYAIASYPFGGLHPGDSNGARKNDGRVKVFARNPATSTWSLQQTLSGNNHYEEFFGYAAAISGDCIVVSSDDGYPNFSSGNGNRMYIYKRDPNLGSWSLSLQQPVSIMNWYMGKHISMTDDHIIVGMKTDTGTGGTNSGAVNVYTRDGTSWSLTKRFLGGLLGYYFGQFVNISGTKFLVHQLGSNNTGNTNGSIHFYNLEHSLEVSSPISVFGTTLSFTGQHLCSPEGPMSQGLVVSANKNRYTTLNGPLTTGSRAIRSSEALPVVSLSESQNDRSVFGVVDRFESGDGTTRNQTQGATIVMSTKEIGDQKVIVNSLGEGAVWVVNTNGAVVSGDYLTTSNVSGYTQKQDDDILHNYTVAKITMDCDFNPVDLPVQVIKKKENGENDLDQYGRIQWEDTERTEKSYHLRYLTTDGTVTDEANAVWTAAYVGCTYHCG